MPACLVLAVTGDLQAQQAPPTQPRLWDETERVDRVDASSVQRLRFLTVLDDPPFSFLDKFGKLAGLHVDLVRAICEELNIAERCQIQALPFEELISTLQEGNGDAIIAGLPATAENRRSLIFTRPYLLPAARFLTSRNELGATQPASFEGRRVGVLAGSTHETLLRRDMPDVDPAVYTREDWMLEDLKSNKIDAVFGDAARYSVWLAGPGADGCCAFASGPYLAPDLFGDGWMIAVSERDRALADALNAALRTISNDQRFEQIFFRYFPLGIY
ncbi:amino acid ABC transporter [Notoacmeibacter ruber]|uniref:Amino acid ABC transporter n=1 Tax=Notoacmeibacter ruber TaxID=2670375 RepID=A0A3L7JLD0_9HYPH|nr:amino acid ABC transporter [Notoacmeibacter ruber]